MDENINYENTEVEEIQEIREEHSKRKEVEQQPTTPEVKVVVVNEQRKKKKGFNFFKLLIDLILFIVFLVIIASAILGFLNTQNISEGKEPVWCLKQNVQEKNNETKTTCDLGVFRIVKVEDSKETVISFKPFFISD